MYSCLIPQFIEFNLSSDQTSHGDIAGKTVPHET